MLGDLSGVGRTVDTRATSSGELRELNTNGGCTCATCISIFRVSIKHMEEEEAVTTTGDAAAAMPYFVELDCVIHDSAGVYFRGYGCLPFELISQSSASSMGW